MKNPIKLFCLMLPLVVMSCNGTQKKGNSPSFEIDYEKYTLANGLDVILHNDASDPIVSVAIVFHVGSNREKPGRTGFAHFFEHMLFQNSENVGKGKFFTILEELGGDFNGGTSNDETVYYEVVPKDALERVLWMESDRMGFMINTVTEAVLENEKQVVKNEKRQRVDNQPYGHAWYVVDKALYPEGHPYNWQVIGSLEDLEAATLADVKEFYNKWYGPNNATLVIAGDIDFEKTKELVEKYFGEIPAKPEVEKIVPLPVKPAASVKLMHEDNFAELPEIRMVWPSVEIGHPDSYALDYLAEILSDGKRAPFYKEIVENRKLAPSVNTFNYAREIAGQFMLICRGNDGVDLDSINAGIQQALADFEQQGIDDRDMERIKNKQEKEFYQAIADVLSKSFQLAEYNEFRGSPDALEEDIRKILAVTKQDVMRVYETYIKGKPFVMTSFVPKGQSTLAVEGSATAQVVEEPIEQGAEAPPMEEKEEAYEKTPSKVDRTVMPALGQAPTVAMPSIWTKTLGNQLKVYGIDNNELPIVQFSLRLKGGVLLDDPKKVGVANMMTDIMMEGTAGKTPEELQDAIGQLGSEITMSTSQEYITVSGSCLARNFAKTMEIFEEILLQPRWDEKEFERIKQSTITTLQQNKAQPGFVASTVFNKLIYGENHILSNYSYGKEETIGNISIDELKAFYDKYYSPVVSSFHIAGAIDEAQVLSSLQSLEQNWPAKPVDFPEYAIAPTPDKPSIYFVDVPEAKQSVVYIGSAFVKGNDPDYYLATVVNERLGNGTSARLFQQLREEKGYTYGAYSNFTRRTNPGYFVANSNVRSNVTRESVELFKQILEGYQTSFSQDDLDKTKTMLVRGNARRFESLFEKMGILQTISTYDLPLNYIDQEQQSLQTLDLDKAKKLIGNYINPEKMIYVVVGDAKTQGHRLKDLGLGEPIFLDKDGLPVKTVLN